jgi:hypothetical protein
VSTPFGSLSLHQKVLPCRADETFLLIPFRYREQTTLFAKLASQSAALSTSSSVLYSPPPSRTTDPNPSPIQFRKLEKGEKEDLEKKVKELAMSKIVRR